MEPAVRFGPGLARTVDWYRDNAQWWEPIRSGDYRSYYEHQYGRARAAVIQQLDTEIGDLVLVEPDVHGDERGFLIETFATPPGAGWESTSTAGQPLALGAGHSPRSPLPDLARSGKLVRCLRGRVWDVAVDLQRDALAHVRGSGRDASSTTSAIASCSSRSGSPRVLRPQRDRRRRLQAVELRRPHGVRDRVGRPRRRHQWPVTDPRLSRRDQHSSAPRRVA